MEVHAPAKPDPSKEIVEVRQEWIMALPAHKIWDILIADNRVGTWHPRIARSVEWLDDQGRRVRKLSMHKLPGADKANEIIETELIRSHPLMTITYYVEQQDLPFDDYLASMDVTPVGPNHAKVVWQCRMVMHEPRGRFTNTRWIVSDFYRDGLAGLAKLTDTPGA